MSGINPYYLSLPQLLVLQPARSPWSLQIDTDTTHLDSLAQLYQIFYIPFFVLKLQIIVAMLCTCRISSPNWKILILTAPRYWIQNCFPPCLKGAGEGSGQPIFLPPNGSTAYRQMFMFGLLRIKSTATNREHFFLSPHELLSWSI